MHNVFISPKQYSAEFAKKTFLAVPYEHQCYSRKINKVSLDKYSNINKSNLRFLILIKIYFVAIVI